MAFGKWMARKGAVGGTARFVAKAFWSAFENKLIDMDNFSSPRGLDEEIRKVVIAALNFRFAGNVDHPDYRAILNTYDSSVAGLEALTISILIVEAGYMKNSYENKEMFREIIVEELKKSGVGDKII